MPPWLTTDWVLGQFSDRKKRAQGLYRKFVERGITAESVWKELKGQVFLGDKDFVERTKSAHTGKGLKEVPRTQRYASHPSLASLFSDAYASRSERNEAIRCAYFEHGYSLKEISDVLNLHYTTISKIINDKTL